MNTFRFLARLWHFDNQPRHPLVRMERRLAPRWENYQQHFRLLQRRLWQIGLVVVIVGACMEVTNISRVSFLLLALTIFIPLLGIGMASGGVLVLILWPVLIGLAGGGVIAREKDAQTWNLLLVTPLSRLDLLLAKLVVGLSRQQRFIMLAIGLQFFPMLAIASQVGYLLRTAHGVIPMLLMGATMVLFVIERMQLFVSACLLGLVASMTAGSWSLALAGSVALGVIALFARMMITYVVLIVLSGGKLIDPGQSLFFGLPAIAGGAREAWVGIALLAVLLIVQELLIHLAIRWIVRRLGGD